MDIAILVIVLLDILLSYHKLKATKVLPVATLSRTIKAALLVKNYIIRQLIIVCLIGNAFWPEVPLWLKLDLPMAIKTTGLILALSALALRQWAYSELKENWSHLIACPDKLILSGPYRFVRHPIYSSYLLMAIAGVLATGSVTLLLLGVIFFALDNLRAREEEKILSDKFGDQYRLYALNTGRYFPLLRSPIID
ncbi:MAG: isoprenylcysteine carboxylmethyltransferase family protein [Candidatus Komeilibacteria bacterium]|nr:isoprenylcysteine carboxylmethyltransferase family protein [Candidatus Komeilibacteria bacterium]